MGVPVGFGDGAGVGYDRLYFPFGILTATTSTTLVWTCEVRSIWMVPFLPSPRQLMTQWAVAVTVKSPRWW